MAAQTPNPYTQSLPADVLRRLKNVVQAFADFPHAPRAVVNIQMLRDAVAEIERLRETVRRVSTGEAVHDPDLNVTMHLPSDWPRRPPVAEAPKPERWEIDSLVRDAVAAGKIEWSAEPFAVTSMPTPCSVRIWFRRRVPA